MKTICPYCEAKRDVDIVNTKETIEIKGERYAIPVTYYRCTNCKGEFDDPAGRDPLEKAYAEYRSRHGMLHPEVRRSRCPMSHIVKKHVLSHPRASLFIRVE